MSSFEGAGGQVDENKSDIKGAMSSIVVTSQDNKSQTQ